MKTILHRAWLAWRSPPGLSRKRPLVLPNPAGIGQAPQRCRPQGCFGAQPVGVIAGGDDQEGGDVGAGAVTS